MPTASLLPRRPIPGLHGSEVATMHPFSHPTSWAFFTTPTSLGLYHSAHGGGHGSTDAECLLGGGDQHLKISGPSPKRGTLRRSREGKNAPRQGSRVSGGTALGGSCAVRPRVFPSPVPEAGSESRTTGPSPARRMSNDSAQGIDFNKSPSLKGWGVSGPYVQTVLMKNTPRCPLLTGSVRLSHSRTCGGPPDAASPASNSQQPHPHGAASPGSGDLADRLTHADARGEATMVDVGGKPVTRRTAVATATVQLPEKAFRLVQENQLDKGDALGVARVAGIMAAKQTSALIPLCHPLPLDKVAVSVELVEAGGGGAAVVTVTCQTTARTGVEMEALTAAAVAALTLYDMCKAVSHDITITDVRLVSKTGGQRGDYQRGNQSQTPQQLSRCTPTAQPSHPK